jgi:hypothetical protein
MAAVGQAKKLVGIDGGANEALELKKVAVATR